MCDKRLRGVMERTLGIPKGAALPHRVRNVYRQLEDTMAPVMRTTSAEPLRSSVPKKRPLVNSAPGSRKPTAPLEWLCDQCGVADASVGALPCVGSLCCIELDPDVYAADGKSLCYKCARITTHKEAAKLPDFKCKQCTHPEARESVDIRI